MSCISDYRAPEEFIPRSYENTAWTKFLHNRVPRFGNSNNVFDLAGTQEEQDEYVRGLIASAIALAVLFGLWMAALFYFKVRGPAYFSWLSGRREALPAEPKPDGINYDDDKEDLALIEEDVSTLSVVKRGRQKLGLSLGKTRHGAIVVYKIDENSMFSDSGVQVGQRIAAVNDTKCPNDLKEAVRLIQNCDGGFEINVYNAVQYEDMAVIEWDAVFDKAQRQQRKLRHAVFAALVVIISMGIVLCSSGVQALSEVVNTGVRTFDLIEDRIGYGVELLDEVLFSIKNIEKDGIFLLEAVNESCPKKADKICEDFTDPESCRTNIGVRFVPGLQEAITYIGQEDTYQESIQEASDELEYLTSQTHALTDDVKKIHNFLYAVMILSIALSVVCVCIVAGMGFNMPQVIHYFQRYFTYPLFVILVVFSFILSVGFMVASLVLADTCYGDPGPKITAIVDSTYSGSSDLMDDVILRIFDGCKAPPESLHTNMDFLKDGVSLFEQLSVTFDEFEPQREAVCGNSGWSASNLNLAINNKVNAQLCEASDHLSTFEDFFTCRFWYPIYYKAVHESMCDHGTRGLGVIATTQIVVVFMALLVLTYRAALWEINVSLEEDTSANGTVFKEEKLRRPDPLSSETSRLSSQTSRMTDDSAHSLLPSDKMSPFDESLNNTSIEFSFDVMECNKAANVGAESAVYGNAGAISGKEDDKCLGIPSSVGFRSDLTTVCEEDCLIEDSKLRSLAEIGLEKLVVFEEKAQHSAPAANVAFGIVAVEFAEIERLPSVEAQDETEGDAVGPERESALDEKCAIVVWRDEGTDDSSDVAIASAHEIDSLSPESALLQPSIRDELKIPVSEMEQTAGIETDINEAAEIPSRDNDGITAPADGAKASSGDAVAASEEIESSSRPVDQEEAPVISETKDEPFEVDLASSNEAKMPAAEVVSVETEEKGAESQDDAETSRCGVSLSDRDVNDKKTDSCQEAVVGDTRTAEHEETLGPDAAVETSDMISGGEAGSESQDEMILLDKEAKTVESSEAPSSERVEVNVLVEMRLGEEGAALLRVPPTPDAAIEDAEPTDDSKILLQDEMLLLDAEELVVDCPAIEEPPLHEISVDTNMLAEASQDEMLLLDAEELAIMENAPIGEESHIEPIELQSEGDAAEPQDEMILLDAKELETAAAAAPNQDDSIFDSTLLSLQPVDSAAAKDELTNEDYVIGVDCAEESLESQDDNDVVIDPPVAFSEHDSVLATKESLDGEDEQGLDLVETSNDEEKTDEEAEVAARDAEVEANEEEHATSDDTQDDSSSLQSFVESLEASLASMVEAIEAQENEQNETTTASLLGPTTFERQESEESIQRPVPLLDEASDESSSSSSLDEHGSAWKARDYQTAATEVTSSSDDSSSSKSSSAAREEEVSMFLEGKSKSSLWDQDLSPMDQDDESPDDERKVSCQRANSYVSLTLDEKTAGEIEIVDFIFE